MKQHFIKTKDEHTANILRESGLIELEKEGSFWVFVNDISKINFSS